jgi:hypothetical protein
MLLVFISNYTVVHGVEHVKASLFCFLSGCPGFVFCPHSTKHNTNIHAPGGIRTRNPSRREATELRPRPRGHWDRILGPPNP